MSCSACASPDSTIHQGALAPYALVYDVTSAGAPYDLSAVSAANFRVYRENGSEDLWAAVLTNQTTTTLTLTHIFVAGDVPDLETVKVVPEMATPAGTLFAAAYSLKVIPKKEISA